MRDDPLFRAIDHLRWELQHRAALAPQATRALILEICRLAEMPAQETQVRQEALRREPLRTEAPGPWLQGPRGEESAAGPSTILPAGLRPWSSAVIRRLIVAGPEPRHPRSAARPRRAHQRDQRG